MSGMLNGSQGIPPDLIASLMQYAKDPLTKPMPGEGLLGPGMMPQQQMPMGMQGGDPGMGPGMQGMDPNMQPMNPTQQQEQGGPPGLPELRPDMGGFGLGQFAPEMNEGNPVRQQLIQQLMGMLPNLGRGIGGIE